MKYWSVVAFLLFSMPVLQAQNGDAKELEQTLLAYFQAIDSKNHKKTIDFLYPKIFDYIPKMSIYMGLHSMYSDTTLNLSTRDYTIQKIVPVLEKDNVKYSLVYGSYLVDISYHIKNQEIDIEKATYYLFLKFKEIFGEKNVRFNYEKQNIEIFVEDQIYAFKDGNAAWKFLRGNEENIDYIKKIIPKKIFDKLMKGEK
jgi:hypothetical protein